MSIFRIYPIKDNCITSGLYQNFNSGQAKSSQLYYGGGLPSSNNVDLLFTQQNFISRLLIQFDLTELTSKINSFEIGNITSIKLKMKNAIPSDSDTESLGSSIASSFDLIAVPINQQWDEGLGFDQIPLHTLQRGTSSITGFSNWNYSTQLAPWPSPGLYTNPITASTFTATTHFDVGNEDMCMEVLPIVQNWLSGGSTNYGFLIAYSQEFESITSSTRFVSSFLTRHTLTAYKPCLEIQYDQTIVDDRSNVTNNRISKLFLYTYSGNSATNYFSAGTVSIQNSNGSYYATGLTPNHLSLGVYYIDILMSSTTKGQIFKDIWQDITFIPFIDQQNYVNSFIIRDNYYLNSKPTINEYAISIYGLENNKTIINDQVIKVFVDTRVNYSTNMPSTPYSLSYKMVMNNEEEVIPWTLLNQISADNYQRENYFILDTCWLLENQVYRISFMIQEAGSKRILPEYVEFKVLRPF